MGSRLVVIQNVRALYCSLRLASLLEPPILFLMMMVAKAKNRDRPGLVSQATPFSAYSAKLWEKGLGNRTGALRQNLGGPIRSPLEHDVTIIAFAPAPIAG